MEAIFNGQESKRPKTGLTTKHWFGYMFGGIPDLDTRSKMADNGEKLICGMVERMDTAHVVEHLRKLEVYGRQNEANYPWMPAAWNKS